ncbi:MAG: RidA family protein, partial [Actinomycetota bacterium]
MAVSRGDSLEHPYTLVRRAGPTAYVSGVLPYGLDGEIVHDRDEAIERVLAVLAERLDAAGLSLDDVVKTTVYLTDLAWRDALNVAFHRGFRPPRPARTAVEVRALPRGAAIE